MSLGKLYTVWCDGRVDGTRSPNCKHWVGQEQESKAARALARRAGWQRAPKNAADGPADRCRSCRVDS